MKIQIPRKNSHNKSEAIDDIIMICDPEENGYEFEFISDYNEYFDADIYPIAISTGPPDIFMDSTGAFYAMYGSIGAKWGNSFEEFILNIMDGNVSNLEKIC